MASVLLVPYFCEFDPQKDLQESQGTPGAQVVEAELRSFSKLP